MPDREKVFDAIRNCITVPKCRDCSWDECEKFDCKKVRIPVSLMLDALKLLKEKETVVHCKDCKKWHTDCLPSCGRHGCNVIGDYTKPDDFCSFAERMEGGEM